MEHTAVGSALTPIDRGADEWVAERTLAALARGESVEPCALTLLLRLYVETGRDDLAEAVGAAVARALDAPPDPADPRANEWLMLLADVSRVSSDERVSAALARGVSAQRDCWPEITRVADLALSIEACLTAEAALHSVAGIPAIVGRLEDTIGVVYRPGCGVTSDLAGRDGARALADQIRMASALLTAFEHTSRLPYAMLAEELVIFATRTFRDSDGAFVENDGASGAATKPFALNCETARVLVRCARLHESVEYRGAAVIAPDADYRSDAIRTLGAIGARYRDHGTASAVYALAVLECGIR